MNRKPGRGRETLLGFWSLSLGGGSIMQSVLEKPGTESLPEVVLQANAKFGLYPFLIRKNNSKDYSLIRLGCRTVTVLWTTHFGVVASRLLSRGYSTAEASARMSSIFKCAHVDLQPLLKALYEARMIRSVNGQTIESEAPSLTREWNQRIEWLRMRTAVGTGRALLRYSPIPVAHRAMCFLRPKWSRRKSHEVRGTAQQNLTSVFGGSLTEKRISGLAHEYLEEQIRKEVDLALLNALPELRVGKWLRRCCTFQGLEHLDNALAAGKGVLLSSFHFSSAHLIVLLLWMRGYSFTGAGGLTRSDRNRVLPFDDPELAQALKGCGTVKWFTTMTLESALKICRTVNQGGLGLVFPDGFTTRSKADVDLYFGHSGALYKRAQCDVPFLGRTAQANTGVSWIYKQSSAPLIPIKVVRVSFHRFQIVVGPEVKLDRAASLERVTAGLYAALEREIALDPAAWSYWKILDQFTTRS
jgi:lauroyl/myristoyl acyltransferase